MMETLVTATAFLSSISNWLQGMLCIWIGGTFAYDIDSDWRSTILLTGIVSIFLSLVYGILASWLVARNESSAERPSFAKFSAAERRALRMSNQGGHTVMLAYFAGLGTLAEYVRMQGCEDVPSLTRLHRAAKIHLGIVLPQFTVSSLVLIYKTELSSAYSLMFVAQLSIFIAMVHLTLLYMSSPSSSFKSSEKS